MFPLGYSQGFTIKKKKKQYLVPKNYLIGNFYLTIIENNSKKGKSIVRTDNITRFIAEYFNKPYISRIEVKYVPGGMPAKNNEKVYKRKELKYFESHKTYVINMEEFRNNSLKFPCVYSVLKSPFIIKYEDIFDFLVDYSNASTIKDQTYLKELVFNQSDHIIDRFSKNNLVYLIVKVEDKIMGALFRENVLD